MTDSRTLPQAPDTPHVIRAWIYSSALSARYYGAPVYLVGSAVTSRDPRDIDIVIPLADELFVACYGDPGEDTALWRTGLRTPSPPPIWRRWARDCAKQSYAMTMYVRRAVDFTTQPQSHFDTYAGKRVRLDCRLMESERVGDGGKPVGDDGE